MERINLKINEPRPEDKERFNELVKGMNDAINQFTYAYGEEYETIQRCFDAYFKKEGIIIPASADEFLTWLAVKYPDEPIGNMVAKAKDPHNYKLFHEYQVRRVDNRGWDLDKELEFWQKGGEYEPNNCNLYKFDKIIDAAFQEHEPEKYIERQMRIAERDFFYKPDDFIDDLLLRLSERLNSINKKFEKDKASIGEQSTDGRINALIGEHAKTTARYSTLEKKIKRLKNATNVGQKDLSKFDDLFIPELGKAKTGEKSPLERFKKDLETSLPSYNKTHITALAGAIYEGEILHRNIKPRVFSGWLEMFCEIIGAKEVPKIRSSTVSKEIEQMKKTYYYLFE